MLKSNTLDVWEKFRDALEGLSTWLPVMVEILRRSAEEDMIEGKQLTNGAGWLMERLHATSPEKCEALRPTYIRASEKQFTQDLTNNQLLAMAADFGGEAPASIVGETGSPSSKRSYPGVIQPITFLISGTHSYGLSGRAPVPPKRLLFTHPTYGVQGTRLIQSTLTLENLRHYLNTFQPQLAKPEWVQDMLRDNTLTVWSRFIAAWKAKSANLPIMVEILVHSAEAEMNSGNQLTNGAGWLMEGLLAVSMDEREGLRLTYERACGKQFSHSLTDDQLLAMTADSGGGTPAYTVGETGPASSAAFSSRSSNRTSMLETPNQTTIGSGPASNEAAR